MLNNMLKNLSLVAASRRTLAPILPILAVALTLLSAPATAEGDPEFSTWLGAFRAEAAERGIKEEILDAALTGIAPIPRIIELDRAQPEFTMTFEEYLGKVVPQSRVRKGRKKLAENRELLEKIGAEYGVQPRFIVAFWGVETSYGRHTGGFSVVTALATLAYDGRRSDYFRKELHNALRILNQGHVTPANMKGSWAGAMGQCQFMPSSFLNFAVDSDGDQRRDIWTTKADVFASAANYLASSGWKGDQTWGRGVTLPKGFDTSVADLKIVKPLSEWQDLGVRRADGSDLPTRAMSASLVIPGGEKAPEGVGDGKQGWAGNSGDAFLVYDNYRTILKWNRSTFFAMAIGHLADAIGRR
jgi:membrane-bound lytic murein transglycosylase B